MEAYPNVMASVLKSRFHGFMYDRTGASPDKLAHFPSSPALQTSELCDIIVEVYALLFHLVYYNILIIVIT